MLHSHLNWSMRQSPLLLSMKRSVNSSVGRHLCNCRLWGTHYYGQRIFDSFSHRSFLRLWSEVINAFHSDSMVISFVAKLVLYVCTYTLTQWPHENGWWSNSWNYLLFCSLWMDMVRWPIETTKTTATKRVYVVLQNFTIRSRSFSKCNTLLSAAVETGASGAWT